ncbi:MAG TPA: sugar phosphate isomerase/epimerase family protein [Steroidobacteraceae bacterium]|nr:sugar phosphate isomerase/epimerase family protein [Steroidobacteraceae bacterium]
MPRTEESPVIALCWGTLIGTALEPLIEAAGSAGLGAITLTAGMYEACRDAGVSDAQLRRLLAANGVKVHAIDPLIGALPGTPRPADVPAENRAYFEFTEERCYRAAEALEAETINLAHFGGGAVPEQDFVDCLGPLAERARSRGLRLTLEFLPESAIPDLASAQRIVSAVGEANLGVMLDTWHFARTHGTCEQLQAVPRGLISGLQISDRREPPPGTPYAPMFGRLLPGEGELPLVPLLRELLGREPGLTVGVEVFSEELRALTPKDAAARVASTTARVLREVRGGSVSSP